MSNITQDVFAGLLTTDFDEWDDTLPQYELTGEITTVVAGEWHEAKEVIEVGDVSKAFNTRWRLTDPILSSVILRKTETVPMPEGRIDFNATVVSHRELEVQWEDQWFTLSNFVAHAIRKGSASAASRSVEDILNMLRQYGFDPTARLPMYLQHLGAGEEAFEAIAADFSHRGAVENTSEVQSRARGTKSKVMHSYRHREGIPVPMLEISKANRSLSQTGAGFIGFLDASWSTLLKVLSLHSQRIALNQILTSGTASKHDLEEAAAKETQIRSLFTVATNARAFRNWGGTTEVPDTLDDKVIPRYFAQQVPCGRLSVGSLQAPTTYSVWTTARSREPQMSSISPEAAEVVAAKLPDGQEF